MPQQIILKPEMGEAILTHLGKKCELPKFGVVAGQAVASAIDDLWGKGGGVYNDIDVFVPSSGKVLKIDAKASATAARAKPKLVSKTNSGYGGSVYRHLEMVQTYRIEQVRYLGLVNKVYFQLPNNFVRRLDDHARRIIEGFDINAVRVGVDVRTKRLTWDAHFEQFLHNRELRIAACYTPVHSLIRLLKKARELSDVMVDVETAARITGMLLSDSVFATLKSQRLVSVVFGDKFLRLAKTLKSEWEPYCRLDAAWFFKQYESGGWQQGYGDESTYDVKELHQMGMRGAIDKADEAFARQLELLSVVALPTQVYRDRDRRTNCQVSVLSLSGLPRKTRKSFLPDYALMRGGDYFEGMSEHFHANGDVTRYPLELETFLDNSRWAPLTFGWQAERQLRFSQQLEELESTLGIPDSKAFMAGLQLPRQVVDFETARQHVLKELAAQRQRAHTASVPVPDVKSLGMSAEACALVQELGTRRELEECQSQRGIHACEYNNQNWGSRYFLLSAQPAVNEAREFAVLQIGVDADGNFKKSPRLVWPGFQASTTAAGVALEELSLKLTTWLMQAGMFANATAALDPEADLPV